ncbi:site-specific integrase [Dyella monticola]|uniref:Site-specific integrase n=1 Tax=Dyella monticola TaxID=1927958 RepID=A0A370X3G7_9GAMM|nr:site-specific integrase [Dyella monticola]RDS82847.1 site-specific integrase [Dyella monticola]
MATFLQLPSGNWRVQVRRKGHYLSETFRRRKDADSWALDAERRIDRGEKPTSRTCVDPTTFEHLIDLHLTDMHEVGKSPRRTKRFSLELLREKLGKVQIRDLGRERFIQFGRNRAKEGAGPATLSMDIGYIRTILSHAAAVHGIDVSTESIALARIALKRLGLVGKSRERDRRPTPDEISRIIEYAANNPRQTIPIDRIVPFAIATAMREDEICRFTREDVNQATRTLLVRDRKDPREKEGNNQKVPLLDATGFDAWRILQTQARLSKGTDRVFPYNPRSVGTAFRRICKKLKIKDLHFHDLRHEATSRLFEAGFSIEQVVLVTGHKDWKMLKRYANLHPENLHSITRSKSFRERNEKKFPGAAIATKRNRNASKRDRQGQRFEDVSTTLSDAA